MQLLTCYLMSNRSENLEVFRFTTPIPLALLTRIDIISNDRKLGTETIQYVLV